MMGSCTCTTPTQEPSTEQPKESRVDAGRSDSVTEDARASDSGTTCQKGALLEHTLWKNVERANDPYRSMAPPGECKDVAYKLEDGVIEVETGICSFLTVTQPLARDLPAGTKLHLIYWHLQLTAASSAFGYFSLTMNDTEIHVNKIPIPSPPKVYDMTLTLKKDFKKGQPIYFHIHNHGSNSWKLLSLDVVCP
jgi:hypothetical protein